MNTNTFVLIHGLPGAGKTTLCNQLAQMRDKTFFANIGSSPEFRQTPMHSICANLILENPDHDCLVTEACLPEASVRDRFVTNILTNVESASGRKYDHMLIILLNESIERLTKRRNRGQDEYTLLKNQIQTSSRKYRYLIYDAALDDELSRADKINSMIFHPPCASQSA